MPKTVAYAGDSIDGANAALPAANSHPLTTAMGYGVDAAQRAILFWDVMRQRSNQFLKDSADPAPQVLSYEAEVVIDGRTFERPVNYRLLRIVPPEGVQIDPTRRPFVVVDPRAGHGPGIGGFKADSEIGVAIRRAIHAIWSPSCPIPCLDRPSRILPAPKRSSSKR